MPLLSLSFWTFLKLSPTIFSEGAAKRIIGFLENKRSKLTLEILAITLTLAILYVTGHIRGDFGWTAHGECNGSGLFPTYAVLGSLIGASVIRIFYGITTRLKHGGMIALITFVAIASGFAYWYFSARSEMKSSVTHAVKSAYDKQNKEIFFVLPDDFPRKTVDENHAETVFKALQTSSAYDDGAQTVCSRLEGKMTRISFIFGLFVGAVVVLWI
jgi:hypothetical protein